MGIGGVAVTGQLAIDPCAPCGGVFEGLEHKHAGALAHDEAVATGVERPGGVLGVVVAGAERLHGSEAAHRGGKHSRLGAAGDHDVGIAHDECAPCLADGVVGGGAGGTCGDVGAAQAVVKREHPGGHVEDHHRDEKRGHAPRTAVEQGLVLALERGEAADPGADHCADAVAVGLVEVKAGVVERLPTGVDAELGKPVGAADLLG